MGNISGYRGIAINILPGTDIGSAIYKAFLLAGELECEVVFNFNGCWLNVGPEGMSKKEAVQEYHEYIAQSTRIRELEGVLGDVVRAYGETGEVASAIRGCEQALNKKGAVRRKRNQGGGVMSNGRLNRCLNRCLTMSKKNKNEEEMSSEQNVQPTCESGNSTKPVLAVRAICEVVYDLNVAMLFSGVFDKIQGRDIRQLMENVLTKHGVWEEYQKFTVEQSSGHGG